MPLAIDTNRELFEKAFSAMEQATREAVSISEAAIGIEHTGRQNRALFAFAKLIAHCMSILAIVDKFNDSPKGSALLDHGSLATLSRATIDAALMTMYISEPKLVRDTWDLRRQVLFLHDLCTRKRFLTAMTASSLDVGELAFFENYGEIKKTTVLKITELGDKLRLSRSALDELTSGQKVFIDGSRGAVREAGWNNDIFEFQQSYLSNWVHSHPVSFIRASEQGISFSNPSGFQLAFSALVFSSAVAYLEDVNSRMKHFTGSIDADPVGQLD